MALVPQAWRQQTRGAVQHLFMFIDCGAGLVPHRVCDWKLGVRREAEPLPELPRCWRCLNRPSPQAQEYMP